jgi:hypothetical protein
VAGWSIQHHLSQVLKIPLGGEAQGQSLDQFLAKKALFLETAHTCYSFEADGNRPFETTYRGDRTENGSVASALSYHDQNVNNSHWTVLPSVFVIVRPPGGRCPGLCGQ